MRILQVAHGYPPEKWGGAELVTATLVQSLAQRGHAVTVFARTADPAAEEFSVQQDPSDTDGHTGVRVVRVVNNLSHASQFRLEYDHPFLDEAFHRVLTDTRPDVVHVQHVIHLSGSVLQVPAQLGYPVVLSLHDFFFACARIHLVDNHRRLCPGPDRGERCGACLHEETSADEARRRFQYFERLLHIPRQVIVPSQFLADRMAALFPFLEPRLQVLAPGVLPVQGVRASSPQTTAARTAALPEQIQPEDRKHQEPMRVLYIGALVPHKGPHLILQAVRGVSVGGLTVSLYGERAANRSAYAERLETDATGRPVRFCGPYRHAQLSAILARHDVLVVPSICEETFSLVTREALQAGLPVIAARRGALPEVIQDGVNGLLFEAGNADDLRRCLERLRTDTRLREQLAPASTPMRDPQAYAQDMEAVYEAVREDKSMEDRPRPGPLAVGEGRPELTSTRAVSVCLPTYNGAAFIKEALDSVLGQTYQDFELLIVDDGSTDTTLDIVQSFSDPRIQLHRNPERLGIPANWNRCLELAGGAFVCVFHQDDVMLPDNLERKVQVLSADETVGFVHSGVETLVDESAPDSFADWIEDATDDTVWDGPEYFRTLLLNGNRVCAPTVLARRSALLEQGGFDRDLGFACDYAMWLRLCLRYRVGFLARPLVRYRWHGGNASHAYQFERGVEEITTAARRGLRLYRERGAHADGPVLDEALTALDALRHWAAELQRGKAWLEGQQASWRSVVETQNGLIRELKGWIAELETGKAWLEEQRTTQQAWIDELEKGKAWLEEQRTTQQAWIGELEKGKAWLEEHRNNWENIARQRGEQAEHWQAQAEHWQTSLWGRLGLLLRLVNPARELPAKESKSDD